MSDPNDFNPAGHRIHLACVYPGLPPTSNKLYILGSKLTGPAREYKTHFCAYIQQTYGHQIGELEEPNQKDEDGVTDLRTKNPNLIYGLTLVLYMDCLTSWGNPEIPKGRRAAFRFKKIDTSNRIKLIEDCIKTSLDIDDSLTFASSQMKVHEPDPAKERVQFEITVLDVRSFGMKIIDGGAM